MCLGEQLAELGVGRMVLGGSLEQLERQIRSAPSDVGASEHDEQPSPAVGQLVPEVFDQLGAGRTAARNEIVDRLKLGQEGASRGPDDTTSGGSLVGRDDLKAAPIVSQLQQLERVDRAAFEVEAKHFWLGDDLLRRGAGNSVNPWFNTVRMRAS